MVMASDDSKMLICVSSQKLPMQKVSSISFLQVPPYIPYEFTVEGFLERMHTNLQNQNFCKVDASCPSINQMHLRLSMNGQTCEETCRGSQSKFLLKKYLYIIFL